MMNSNRIHTLAGLVALAVAALMAACGTDDTALVNTMDALPLEAGSFNGATGSKAYINSSNYPCWENNDPIHLTRVHAGATTTHNGTVQVNYSGNDKPTAAASASGFTAETGDKVFAGYPSSFFSTISESFSITLPATYTYSTANGRQKVESPMVGKIDAIQAVPEGGTNPNTMKLTSLCSLLDIEVKKPASGYGAVVIDSIAVVNTTSGGTPLSGSGTVSFSGSTPTLSMSGTANSSNNRVVLDLSSSKVSLNADRHFYVPVPPLASGQALQVWVHNYLTGHWTSMPLSTTAAVPGNCIANISNFQILEDASGLEFFDWIENQDKASHINLGVKPSNDMKLEVTYLLKKGQASSQYISGARASASTTSILWFGISSSSATPRDFRSYFCCTNTQDSSQFACTGSDMLRAANTKYRQTLEVLPSPNSADYYYGRTTFERLGIDNSVQQIITKNTHTYEGGISGSNLPNIFVFAINTSQSNHQPAGMRLYSYRIWKDGELLYNFVPAKKDGVVGVYNMAATNAANAFITPTGSFSVGND